MYSFDDYHIGLMRSTGRSLDPKHYAISRPAGIDKQVWYIHAAIIVKLLNKLNETATTGNTEANA